MTWQERAQEQEEQLLLLQHMERQQPMELQQPSGTSDTELRRNGYAGPSDAEWHHNGLQQIIKQPLAHHLPR